MPFSPEERARFANQRDVLKRSFDGVAEQYAAARPDYPEALFEAIIKLARLPFDARLLEIGAGPGIATHHFAARGYPITALEPGEALAAVARRALAAYPRAQVVAETFEAWPLDRGGYDLVYAAQAFHWIEPGVAYSKTAAALRRGGAMALFWNRPIDPPAELQAPFDAAYRQHAPAIARMGALDPLDDWIAVHAAQIDETRLFNPVIVRTFPWTTDYNADAYVALLGTYSDHIALQPESREALFGALRDIIIAQGGTLARNYVAALFFAMVAH